MDVIVHGGAGSPPDEPADRQAVLDEAADRGREADDPLAAVCGAVGVLEVDPRFNAGVGSAVQSDGRIRTDAGVMTGTGTTGAVAGMEGVARAAEVARAVATETPHVMLAGERAVAFADVVGVETGVDCWADRTRERWDEESPPTGPADQVRWVRERFGGGIAGDVETDGDAPPSFGESAPDHDTVGAVARAGDAVAAATSTGGRWAALAGRVGDVPQVGAGFYASPAGGASATGAGEDIAREGLARRAVGLLERGADAATAARLAVEEFDDAADGSAGVVVLGADGTAGEAYNSPAMQTARTGPDRD
ncbi:MAG: isoaspartyl peptidase/L-asparaginase [Haloarculaceae archaeon]